MTQPTSQQLDALVRQLNASTEAQKPTDKQQKAAELAKVIRSQLLDLVLQFGDVPLSAPASKRLCGAEYKLTATSATVLTEHPQVVLELRDAMRQHDAETLFAQLFTPATRYDRAKDAANNLKNAALPKKLRVLFDSIFERTSTAGTRAPSLRIDAIK